MIKLGNREIGYINEKQDINDYMNFIVKEEKDIAFIDLKEPIEYKLQLVNRKSKNNEEEIKKHIKNNIDIQYTTYAITYKGKNLSYLSTMEEAEKVIADLEKKNTNTKQVGILQVYSNDYNEIKPESIKDITKKVGKKINNDKKTSTVRVAKTKSSNIKGISFKVKPLNGVITSRYGNRNSPGGVGSTNHKGLDIAAKAGTTIKASSSGTIKFAGYKGNYGKLVIIDCGNGVETYYAHCSKLYVEKGQQVSPGNKIAAVGSTGIATGSHLHFEIRVNGTSVNPQRYVYR